MTAMAVRTCDWCGTNISHMRSNAKYCCKQHKKNAGSKRHRERNPGYYQRYHGSPARVAWIDANRERIRTYAREQQRRYRLEHPNAGREWREANRVYFQLRERNRKALKMNHPHSVEVSERDWVRLCRRYNGHCAYCDQKPNGTLEMDHVIPLTKGGRHAIGNVLPACRDCNLSKNAALHITWKYRKGYRLMAELYGGTDGRNP